MSKFFCLHALPSSLVTHSCKFVSDGVQYLLIGKVNQLEIHVLKEEGLHHIKTYPVNAQIATIECLKVDGQDYLVMTTNKLQLSVLRWTVNGLMSVCAANVRDYVGRLADVGQLISSCSKWICLHLYDGMIKVAPVYSKSSPSLTKSNTSKLGEFQIGDFFNVPVEFSKILDICFLQHDNYPLQILYETPESDRYVATCILDQFSSNHSKCKYGSNIPVDARSRYLYSVSFGGYILAGSNAIRYIDERNSIDVSYSFPSSTVLTSFHEIEPCRWLFGDVNGNLYVLVLLKKNNVVDKVDVKKIGGTTTSSTITYLDNGFVYIGSASGDSQLIQLSDSEEPILLYEEYAGLAPIVDFALINPEQQATMVACCGGRKNGSLRILTNGISMEEVSTFKMEGVKDIFSLQSSVDSGEDLFLVFSFYSGTRAMGFQNEEFKELKIGLDETQTTIKCATVENNSYVQITPHVIRLIDSKTHQQLDTLESKDDKIGLCDLGSNHLIYTVGNGDTLTYVQIQDGKFVTKGIKKLSNQISCLTMEDNLCAVGLWKENSIAVLSLPELQILHVQPLNVDIVPRSILFETFEGIHYLLCGLGDGQLFHFTVSYDDDKNILRNQKKMTVGTNQVTLSKFKYRDSPFIFACSDEPTVIYGNNKKLLFSNVNMKDMRRMTSFNNEYLQDCLALVQGDSVMIGAIEEIQKIQVKKVPLDQQPRRIVYHPQSNRLGILSIETKSEKVDVNNLLLMNFGSYKVQDKFSLEENEYGSSINTLTLDKVTYLVVGTGYVRPEEVHPKNGRILVFEVDNGSLDLIIQHEIPGICYSLCSSGEFLIAGINGHVHMFSVKNLKELEENSVWKGMPRGYITTSVQADDGFVIVGDIANSVSVLQIFPSKKILFPVARDFRPSWIRSTCIIDHETILAADDVYNLRTLTRNSTSDDDRKQRVLQTTGRFHLGDLCNKIGKGSLKRRPKEFQKSIDTFIFATATGAVGIIAKLSDEDFAFFNQLQIVIEECDTQLGGLSHKFYRNFKLVTGGDLESEGFIDGDLIDSFCNDGLEFQTKVAKKMNLTADDLVKRIEELVNMLR